MELVDATSNSLRPKSTAVWLMEGGGHSATKQGKDEPQDCLKYRGVGMRLVVGKLFCQSSDRPVGGAYWEEKMWGPIGFQEK